MPATVQRAALRVVLPYLLFATLWILLSDTVLEALSRDAASFAHWSRYKGLAFVLTTGLLLVHLLKREFALRFRAESRLDERQRLLDRMGAMAKVGGWEFDVETGEGTWTDEVARIHGIPVEQATSRDFGVSFYQGEDRRAIEDALRLAREEARPYDLVLQFVAADGVRKWVRTQGEPVVEAGRVVRIRGSFQDVSFHQEAIADIQEQSNRLRLALEAARMGVFEQDLVSGRLEGSGWLKGRWGLGQDSVPRSVEALLAGVHPLDRPAVEAEFAACMEEQRRFKQECRLVLPDGAQPWVLALGEFDHDTDGTTVRMRGAIADISERKRLELNLRELVDGIRRLAAANSETETVQRLLEAARRLSGADTSVLLRLEGDECVAVSELADRPFWSGARALVDGCACGRTLLEGELLNFADTAADPTATAFERAGGVRRLLVIPVRGETVHGALALGWLRAGEADDEELPLLTNLADTAALALQQARAHDELEHRVARRTAQLARARDRAESADRVKSAFLATMSHELRTPLNSIIGFSGILLQGLAGPLNEEQAKQLGMVSTSASHLLDLINDVLDISKIEAGELKVERVPFDPDASLDKVLRISRPLAEAKGLSLVLEPYRPLGQVTSDARRVEQVLLNLVGNAIKFTDQGGVTVRVRREEDWLSFEVCDTGIGIRKEDQKRLFQPFRQVETGLSRVHEGTGLGLAICRRLAGLLGGRIALRSELGAGSTFTFTFHAGERGAA